MTRSDRSGRPGSPGAGSAVGAFLGGIGFIAGTPSAWGYALVPVGMLLILGCGFGFLGWEGARQLTTWILGERGEVDSVNHWLIRSGLIVVLLGLGVLLALALAQPLSGWALEALSRKQEQKLTGRCPPEPSFLRSLWIGMRCALFVVLVGGSITVTLLVVSLVFPPAAIVTVPLKFLVVSWLLAWDLVDYPLGLRGMGIRRRLRWVSRHFSPFILFGMLWAVVLLVPGIFFVVLPMGVAGATRLVVAAEREDVLDALPG